MLTQAPRGTKDILPEEIHKWHYVENVLRTVAAQYGFKEIRVPVFEHTELFLRGVGDTTDVVSKEMYTFNDKGGRSVTLRPEGTASVARSFIEHSLDGAGLPVKMYYIVPNFRYENPQAGRLRQHHQFGVECFGSNEPAADAEVIGLADLYLKRLGLSDVALHINSIGCPECRAPYYEKLREYFAPHIKDLCATCLGRLERNPMRVLDCKSEVCSALAAGAPRTIDHLCGDCETHFNGVLGYLKAVQVDYTIDPGIVRGLDYYTGPVFEFICDKLGAQKTVCAGGRYNGLVEALEGKPTAGLGFGSGLERLIMAMDANGFDFPKPGRPELFVAALGQAADMFAQALVHFLRASGVVCERDICARSMKAQMKYANKIGARYVINIGDNEIAAGKAQLKDMDTGETREVALDSRDIAALLNGLR